MSVTNPLVIRIFYGSQTGNSESIAKEIYRLWLQNPKLSNNNNNIQVNSMLDYITHDEKLTEFHNSSINILIFVISTTGAGELPDNATKFCRILRKLSMTNKELLSGAKYCILGKNII